MHCVRSGLGFIAENLRTRASSKLRSKAEIGDDNGREVPDVSTITWTVAPIGECWE
jgi:hypothetical protein